MTHADPSFDALPVTQPLELPWLAAAEDRA